MLLYSLWYHQKFVLIFFDFQNICLIPTSPKVARSKTSETSIYGKQGSKMTYCVTLNLAYLDHFNRFEKHVIVLIGENKGWVYFLYPDLRISWHNIWTTKVKITQKLQKIFWLIFQKNVMPKSDMIEGSNVKSNFRCSPKHGYDKLEFFQISKIGSSCGELRSYENDLPKLFSIFLLFLTKILKNIKFIN